MTQCSQNANLQIGIFEMDGESCKETENLERGDYVMSFDPEFDLWFKFKVLKATANYYVVRNVL